MPAGCRLLELPTNLGFAAGMNFGIAAALRDGFDYVWVLNNDAFPAPDCLHHLLAALHADPGLAVVTPAILNPKGGEDHAGGAVQWANGTTVSFVSAELARPLRFGEWLTGTALLGRAAAWRSVGGFDERFFAYWEDVDWCIRLYRAGWQLRAVPAAHCEHQTGHTASGGGEAPFAAHLATRNAWFFLRKHLPSRLRRRAFIGWFIFNLRTAVRWHKVGLKTRCLAIMGGLWAALRGESGCPTQVLAQPWLRRLVTWQWRRLEPFLNWLNPEIRQGSDSGDLL